MADGGVAMDKSPSAPKMDWTKLSPVALSPEMAGSLSDHLQRLLSIKKTPTSDIDPSALQRDDLGADASVRVKKLLSERDEMWREHERSQIAFVEREHERVLHGLHKEIEKLQSRCAELNRQLADALTTIAKSHGESDETKLIFELENQLKTTRDQLTAMRELHELKQEKILQLKRKCQEQEAQYKQELECKNIQIQEISTDLSHKTVLVAQLTTQLHQLRLREAVEKQRYEQRRHMTERCQALAAAKSEQSPHCSGLLGKAASPRRAQTIPGKFTMQVAESTSTTPSTNHRQSPSIRKGNAHLMRAGASPPISARHAGSSAIPSIMTASSPPSTFINKKIDQEPMKSRSSMVKTRSLSTASKPQDRP